MKTILLLIALLMCLTVAYTFAQNSIVMSSVKKDISVSDRHQFAQLGSVIISCQYLNCGTIGYVLLKVDNISVNNIIVSWDYELINNGVTLSIGLDASHVSLNNNSMQSLKGECDFDKIKT